MTTATPPIRAKLEDPAIVALAARIRDPKLDALLLDIASAIALDKKLDSTKAVTTRYEVKGKERAQLVDTIGAVRAGLARLSNPSPTFADPGRCVSLGRAPEARRVVGRWCLDGLISAVVAVHVRSAFFRA